jgi:hypothetical protein
MTRSASERSRSPSTSPAPRRTHSPSGKALGPGCGRDSSQISASVRVCCSGLVRSPAARARLVSRALAPYQSESSSHSGATSVHSSSALRSTSQPVDALTSGPVCPATVRARAR